MPSSAVGYLGNRYMYRYKSVNFDQVNNTFTVGVYGPRLMFQNIFLFVLD